MPTSSRRRQRYHHGDLQAALLRAAGNLLEKEGIGALRLREIARRAGVSHNAPYRHFPERQALLAALAAEGFKRFRQQLDDAETQGGLHARGEAYVRFALEHPERFRLMFGSGLPFSQHPDLLEQATQAFGGLANAIAAHAGREAPLAAIAAWALVHGLSQLLLDGRVGGAGRGERDVDDFVRAVLASIRFAVVPAQRPA